MTIELKPCPFCGDRDLEITHNRYGEYCVACTTGSDCMNFGPGRITERGAIVAWNHRAPENNTKSELARLRAEKAGLREALRPFVQHYERWMDEYSDDHESSTYARHTFGQLRKARAALSAEPQAATGEK